MARRRYVSTMISQDTRVNRLAIEHGDFAALLYTWMIPHAGDDATLPGDPEELLYQVLPGRRDKSMADVQAALAGMLALGLIEYDGAGRVAFPAPAFYRYQTYIKDRNKRGDDAATTAQDSGQTQQAPSDSAEQRKSAQNTVSSSFPVSPSVSPSVAGGGGKSSPAPKRADARPTLPSTDELVALLTDWATERGVRDILPAQAERFRDYCLAGRDGKPIVYTDYAAACRKWITNPNYGPQSRAHAPPLTREGQQPRRTANNIEVLRRAF